MIVRHMPMMRMLSAVEQAKKILQESSNKLLSVIKWLVWIFNISGTGYGGLATVENVTHCRLRFEGIASLQ